MSSVKLRRANESVGRVMTSSACQTLKHNTSGILTEHFLENSDLLYDIRPIRQIKLVYSRDFIGTSGG